ncbi:MAG: diacylglycerol kinase family protein [Ruminococcus sp.]|nr:diacylglycerol kinase family protein [Ruminococcus sp.]
MKEKVKEKFLKQVHSFKYAISGLLSAFNSEAHMRFHLVVTIYVVAFSLKFYNLSTAQWALLVLTISAVFITEIVNTALERLCDTVTSEYSKNIGFVKDVAAAAVLVSAIAAVCVAFITLFRVDVFRYMLFYFFEDSFFAFIVLILSLLVSALFVALKPSKYKEYFENVKKYFSDKSNKSTKEEI